MKKLLIIALSSTSLITAGSKRSISSLVKDVKRMCINEDLPTPMETDAAAPAKVTPWSISLAELQQKIFSLREQQHGPRSLLQQTAQAIADNPTLLYAARNTNDDLQELIAQVWLKKNYQKLLLKAVSLVSSITLHDAVRINSFATLPSGDLITGKNGDDYSINIWDSTRGQLKDTITSPTNNIRGIAILPNGDIAVGSQKGTIVIFDSTHGTLKHTFDTQDKIFYLTVLTNGEIFTRSWGAINIWDSTTGILKRRLDKFGLFTHAKPLKNNDIITQYLGGTCKIWDSSGKFKATYTDPDGPIRFVEVLSNNDIVVVIGDHGAKIVTPTGKLKHELVGHNNIWDLTVLPHDIIVTLSKDGIANIWDQTGALVQTLDQADGEISFGGVSPMGDILMQSRNKTNVWSLGLGRLFNDQHHITLDDICQQEATIQPKENSNAGQKHIFAQVVKALAGLGL